MTSITTFLAEVRVELGRVAWPTRRQLAVYTAVVLGVSFALAIFLGALDAGFAAALNLIIK